MSKSIRVFDVPTVVSIAKWLAISVFMYAENSVTTRMRTMTMVATDTNAPNAVRSNTSSPLGFCHTSNRFSLLILVLAVPCKLVSSYSS